MDTIWKAHVDVYDAVYPALASQLGAGRQEEEGSAASVLVQVLGVKESADLKEGFGFFVQHVLSGGLEKAHAEGRGKGGARGKDAEKAEGKGSRRAGKKGPTSASAGQMDKVREAMGAVMQSMQSGACMGPDDWLQIMHEYGVDMADMLAMLGGDGGGGMGMGLPLGVGGGGRKGKDGKCGGDPKDPTIGLLTYRVACILQWLRIYGSDSISAKNCFKDSRHGKVLPIRHPLQDLPSLLVRFGAVLPPLDGSTRLLEWEEWPEGNEAAMKFPEDSSARCFGLGRADGSRTNSGNGEAQQGSFPEALLPHQNGESRPIVRCRAEADLIVEFAGLFLEAPACAHCSQCITLYISHAPFIALIANFAYRPVAVLLDRFLSVFKPQSEVFQSLLSRLGLDSSLNAPHDSFSGKRSSTSSSSVRALRERAEQVPVAFLLSLALLCATPLLQQSGTEGGQNSRAGTGTSGAKEKADGRRAESGASGEGMRGGKCGDGEGDSGVVWEEVQSWFTVAMLPASGMGGGGLACSGRMAGEEDEFARVEEASEQAERQEGRGAGLSEGMAGGSESGGMSARDAAGGAVLPPCLPCCCLFHPCCSNH
ncbi:unnamed protein product [Closterium sp. Yama58-4]|nr:unnamed protein product [Closterium sp. Yama58-4]